MAELLTLLVEQRQAAHGMMPMSHHMKGHMQPDAKTGSMGHVPDCPMAGSNPASDSGKEDHAAHH